jgi:hypothetical protein
MEKNRNLNNLILFLIILSAILMLINIVISPVHTDEAWFQHCAVAKDNLGFYTSPAFYDVPVFKGYDYIIPTRLILQLYRFFDIFLDGKWIIIAVRFIILVIFSVAVFLYSHTLQLNKNNNIRAFYLPIVILFYPVIFEYYYVAREELIISAIVLLFLAIEKSELQQLKKDILILALLTIALLFHLNALILFGIYGLLRLDYRKPVKILYLFFACLFILLSYYMVFIDPNIKIFTEQFRLMYFSGKSEKFLSSFNSMLSYILNELKFRYLNLDGRNQLTYPIKLLLILTPFISGLYYTFKYKYLKKEKLFSVSIMVFLLFVGNKYQAYLLYILPVLIAITFQHLLHSQKTTRIFILFLLIYGNAYQVRRILWNSDRNKQNTAILKMIDQNVPRNSSIYASFDFAPYLYPKYKYLTTTHKEGNNFFVMFNIKPANCYLLSNYKPGILKYVRNPYITIASYKQYVLYRIE